jgi:DNA-nicking Smr family endonuclease
MLAEFSRRLITNTVKLLLSGCLKLLDEMSRPEDPDAWKYRPFSKFGGSSISSAMILPQRLMDDLVDEEENNLRFKFH